MKKVANACKKLLQFQKKSQLRDMVIIKVAFTKKLQLREKLQMCYMKSHCEKQSYTRNYKKIYITWNAVIIKGDNYEKKLQMRDN